MGVFDRKILKFFSFMTSKNIAFLIDTGTVASLNTVADLRGCSWGQLPPLHDENLAWCPIFGKKGAPYPDPNALFFSCFVLNVGNI